MSKMTKCKTVKAIDPLQNRTNPVSRAKHYYWVELKPGTSVLIGDVVAVRKGGKKLAMVIPFPISFKGKRSTLYLAWRWMLDDEPSTYPIKVVPKQETLNGEDVKFYRQFAV